MFIGGADARSSEFVVCCLALFVLFVRLFVCFVVSAFPETRQTNGRGPGELEEAGIDVVLCPAVAVPAFPHGLSVKLNQAHLSGGRLCALIGVPWRLR